MSWKNIECRTASKKLGDYDWLLTADKTVYPTDRPVTFDNLDQWYQRNPEFGFFCGDRAGVCAAIPLSREGWVGLVDGTNSESSLGSDNIFDVTRDDAIGLHVYHIEREPKSEPGFYSFALDKLGQAVKKLRRNNPQLAVCGFSGYCVTKQGIGLFKSRFSCTESHLVSTEYIMQRNSRLAVFDLPSDADLKAKMSEGYELINRCQMLVASPGDTSIVWEFLS